MTDLLIERLGHKGDGVARRDGESVHVAKVLPGEVVSLAFNGGVRLVKSSPERVPAFCPYYAQCSGCALQHWAEAPYRAWKRQKLVDALGGVGLSPLVMPLNDAHGRGRRRVSLHVRRLDGVWVAGYMAQRSHTLVPIGHCPVLVPEMQHAPTVAAAFGPQLGDCDVAITHADNGLDVAVKAERKAVPRRLDALTEIFRTHTLTRLSVNGEALLTASAPVVRMGRALVPLPVNGFLQATAEGERLLAALVVEAVGKARNVVDLFCGVGPFAFRLAETMQVTACDSDRAAIDAMTRAAHTTQGLKPLRALRRDLFREPLVPLELNAFEAAVLDPPRAGAEAQVRAITASKLKRVVYVSCDTGTFARDAAILCQGGFQLRHVVPVDQFKWTAHLETVALFTR